LSKPKFYVTTPIYYVNAKPHLGTSYTTIIADVIARVKRMRGFDVLMVTGSDEHSQKIVEAAEAEGKTPLQFCDDIIPSFHEAWRLLEIQDYKFFRTSDAAHVETVTRFFRRIYDKGDIYKGDYSGWYCTPCETFYGAAELVDGDCPKCSRPVKEVKEEAYFFRLSKYQDALLKYYDEHPDFIYPDFRRNEMLNRIREGLKDLCISRSSVTWGIPLPFDNKHVFYVWVDALLTYLTGSGYRFDDKAPHYWPADLNVMAKDIPWFHAVVFPAMLLSFGLPPVKKLIVHGYWLFGEEKMSKSKGNVVSPQDAVDLVGADGLRYFFAREVPLGLDGNFTRAALLGRYNYDLANDLGNLVHRTLSMTHQLYDGVVPKGYEVRAGDEEIEADRLATVTKVKKLYDDYAFSEALQAVWDLVGKANRYIDSKRPWELRTDESRRDEIDTVFATLLNVIRTVLLLVYPVIPGAAQKFWRQIGYETEIADLPWEAIDRKFPAGQRVRETEPVFPRLDIDKLLADETAVPAPAAQPITTKETKMSESQPQPAVENVISIDDFAKVKMVTADVLSCEKVEGTDKLLKVVVNDGTRERVVVAGIAEFYKPDELLGKTIVIVTNLQPRKMRGIVSEGMLLAASSDDMSELSLVICERPVSPGLPVH
jgi:methionyl-tRNA synthetase